MENMTITTLIEELTHLKQTHGDLPVVGWFETGWFISAMGGGELTTRTYRRPSEFHDFVVVLHDDDCFDRD